MLLPLAGFGWVPTYVIFIPCVSRAKVVVVIFVASKEGREGSREGGEIAFFFGKDASLCVCECVCMCVLGLFGLMCNVICVSLSTARIGGSS